MPGTDQLPKFHRPPVDEVALGVQFTWDGALPTHWGAFHRRIRAKYPGVQALPPLQSVFEAFPGSPEVIGRMPQIMLGAGIWPRVLFVAADDCTLIQLQIDRLVYNWRRRPDHPDYPQYEELRVGFAQAFSEFEAFLADEGMPPVVPNLCEVLYVNPMLAAEPVGIDPIAPHRIFRLWSADVGSEWLVPSEGVSFNARYRLVDDSGKPIGRLTANMNSAVDMSNPALTRLEMIARGSPLGAGLAGIQAFHDLGRAAIVRSFAAITTPEMHELWGRYQ